MNAQNETPTKILYPVDYWNQWPEDTVKTMMLTTVRKLENFLGVEKSTINLEERWLETNPVGTSLPLASYLQDVSSCSPTASCRL